MWHIRARSTGTYDVVDTDSDAVVGTFPSRSATVRKLEGIYTTRSLYTLSKTVDLLGHHIRGLIHIPAGRPHDQRAVDVTVDELTPERTRWD